MSLFLPPPFLSLSLSLFLSLYVSLCLFSQGLSEYARDFPQTQATLSANAIKNRYINILPCECIILYTFLSPSLSLFLPPLSLSVCLSLSLFFSLPIFINYFLTLFSLSNLPFFSSLSFFLCLSSILFFFFLFPPSSLCTHTHTHTQYQMMKLVFYCPQVKGKAQITSTPITFRYMYTMHTYTCIVQKLRKILWVMVKNLRLLA